MCSEDSEVLAARTIFRPFEAMAFNPESPLDADTRQSGHIQMRIIFRQTLLSCSSTREQRSQRMSFSAENPIPYSPTSCSKRRIKALTKEVGCSTDLAD